MSEAPRDLTGLLSASQGSLMRVAFDAAPNGLLVVDAAGSIIHLNAQAEEVLGYSRGELIRQSVDILVPERFRQRHRLLQTQFLFEDQSRPMGVGRHIVAVRKDGVEVPVEIGLTSLRRDEGVFVLASIVDISARLGNEQMLRMSELRYRSLASATNAMTWSCPPSGLQVEPQAEWMAFTGQTAEQMLGAGWTNAVHPDDLAKAAVEWRQAVAREALFVSEHRIRRYDGEWRWISVRATPVRDADGEIVEWFGMNIDVTARKETELALRDLNATLEQRVTERTLELWRSEELNRRTLQALPAHIAVLERDGRIVATNKAWEAFAEHNEVAGAPLVGVGANYLEVCRRAIDADDDLAGKALAGIEAVMAGELRQFSMEYPCHSPSEQRWFLMTVTLLHGEDQGGAVIAHLDITECIQQEEKIRFLMQEVNHRSQNLLSVVQAIARQIAIVSPEHFIESFSERIAALSANLNLLVREGWCGIDLEELIRAQLSPFLDGRGARIELCGPKVRMNPSAAQALGMSMHELATNATKYGALSVDAGEVRVAWRIDDEALSINWTERNGPPVSPPKHAGFGTVVTTKLAEQSLRGKAILDYPPTGVSWSLVCPIKHALESHSH